MCSPKQTLEKKLQRLAALTILLWSSAFARAGDDTKPANESDIAIGGYCPVSYQTKSSAVKGDPSYAVKHQGLTYFCADEESRKVFESNPGKYVPQYGGLCTTALGGSYGNRLPSDPEVFYMIDGKLYLFSSLRARNAFDRWPKQYITNGDSLYAIPALNGYCLASYQTSGKAVKGDGKFTRIYRNIVYHFADEAAAKAFEKEPKPFLPKYGGYCAEGMSRGKTYPADPKSFEVIDGATYLFFDDAAKKMFISNPKDLIAKAEAEWTEYEKNKAREDKERIENYRKMSSDGRPKTEPPPASPSPAPPPTQP